MIEADSSLEARYLYRCLFGEVMPMALLDQWVMACKLIDECSGGVMRVDMGRIVARGLDVEAIELWLRITGVRNTLGQKMHAMCYLAEVRAEHFHRWVSPRPSAVKACLSVGWHVFRSGWKLIKGAALVRLHRITP